jgi:hypothetical protein
MNKKNKGKTGKRTKALIGNLDQQQLRPANDK